SAQIGLGITQTLVVRKTILGHIFTAMIFGPLTLAPIFSGVIVTKSFFEENERYKDTSITPYTKISLSLSVCWMNL
ncbi:hypothetical protein Q6247_26255, partial [Klebsiella pneumoniae]